MKYRLRFIFLFFVLGAGLLSWHPLRHVLQRKEKSTLSIHDTHSALSIPRLLAGPVSLPSPTPPLSSSETQRKIACEQQWGALTQIDINSYGANTSSENGIIVLDRVWDLLNEIGQIQSDHPCTKYEPGDELFARSQQILKWCHEAKQLGLEHAWEQSEELDTPSAFSTNQRVRSSPMDKCLSNLTILRQDIADRATKNIPLSAISSLPLLMNKVFAAGRKNPSDFQTLSALVGRMLEIDPSNSGAVSMAVQIAFAAWYRDKGANPPLDSADLENALRRLDPEVPPDFFLSQYQLQYDLERGKTASVEAVAEKLLATEAGKNLGNYYLAQVAYREGDLTTTRKYLNDIASGPYGDLKAEAYIALKRMDTETTPDRIEAPLFPAPGVSLYSAFLFPAKPPDEELQQMAGGNVGFTLMNDGFTEIATTRYRTYLDEAMELLPRMPAEEPSP